MTPCRARTSTWRTRTGAPPPVPEGKFEFRGIVAGSDTLVASFIGYEQFRRPVLAAAGDIDLLVELVPEVFLGQEIVVVADRARLRETPVAFSDVPREEVDRKLGSRDLPLILDDTPGVYATGQGGGAGDARINLRGFDQRNVAVMINGVPVNDMENGWVYWSNFDGLGDATSSDPGAARAGSLEPRHRLGGRHPEHHHRHRRLARRGILIKQEAGSGAFYKTRVGFSSGLINGRSACLPRRHPQDRPRPGRPDVDVGLVLLRGPELPGIRPAQGRPLRRRGPAAPRAAALQAVHRHLRRRLRALPGDRRRPTRKAAAPASTPTGGRRRSRPTGSTMTASSTTPATARS